ncbi:MAG: glycosyl hydrolase [Cyclobacteriaceae bacterium]|nr:glycosyl hydrolase [Cyclobacteriaceae bacterium]
MQRSYKLGIALMCCAVLLSVDLLAQRKRKATNTLQYSEDLYKALEWRSIGPYRGGRSAAVTGVPGKPNLFYFGGAGGGVWRTRDGGSNWENISDGYFGGSIGAVAVSEYDPNVIYVGGGEKTVRGNVSYGYGVWKSTDAGKTWVSKGLDDSRHVSRIRIHPKDPDLVYAAVMGNLFAPSATRGIFRSKDGGQSWDKVLFVSDEVGAVDLILDPNNPRVIYASTWKVKRTPYSLSSGGKGSGLWKSTDGGDTWNSLVDKKGFASGTLGIIGVAVSPANSERVWAMVEAKEGGLFRTDDGGETWKKLNDDRNLRQRAWYYTRVYADPKDEDQLYVLNVQYHKSKDGGKTFSEHVAPHGDHHDLWIAPEDPQRMIIGDDGGAQVSFDGGENWSTYHNQPTAQFYRVTTDDSFPYRIYGAQQDNSTVRIKHRTDGNAITERDWEPTAGGESAHIAIDPLNNDIVYGGSYGGFLSRIDHGTKQMRIINVWPDNPMGHGAEGMKYRFQWNFPIFFSPHDPKKLYTASNHLHLSTNEGQSWELISGDLTRNDPSKLGPSGGPITKDNTAVEYYCTIFAACESPYEKDLLWTGSDDGLVHVSRDGGKNWSNVTPAGLPTWAMINSIDPHPFVKGGAYLAATLYKSGDFAPYLYKTEDYGVSWTQITGGIDNQHFTRVVRADTKRKGLLYAGTESGMYISFDDGNSWKPFQLNLPKVPITDLAIKNDNLIAATQGRSFWLIDDLTPLHQLSSQVASSELYLYKPMSSYRMGNPSFRSAPANSGKNHPGGVMVHYYLKQDLDSGQLLTLEILDQKGELIRSFSNQLKPEKKEPELTPKAGMNRFVWDMRYPEAEKFEGLIMWGAGTQGPKAVPGIYQARLSQGESNQQVEFEILADPRSTSSAADLQAQFDFLMEVRDKLTETHLAIKYMKQASSQISTVQEKVKEQDDMKELNTLADTLKSQIRKVEETLHQTKNRSRQDPLNFPIRLNNKLAGLSQAGVGNAAPTEQAVEFKKEVVGKIDDALNQWRKILEEEIPKFNEMVKQKGVDAISIKQDKVITP